MAKVKTFTVYHDGVKFSAEVKIDARGTFSIKLPTAVGKALDIGSVTGKTIVEVERQFRVKLNEHEAIQTVSRKVIYFAIAMHSRIYVLDEDGDDAMMLDKDDFSTEGTGFVFKASVLIETEIKRAGAESRFQYKKVVEQSIPCGFHPDNRSLGYGRIDVFEWSWRREQYVTNLCKSMEAMLMRMDKLMDDPERLVQIIDEGFRTELESDIAAVSDAFTPRGEGCES